MPAEKPAARLLDTISHTSALSGMIGGMILGAVIGVALVAATIATGGAALAVVAAVGGAVALSGGLGLAGKALGSTFSSVTGSIVAIGAPNVLINARPAARATVDTGICSKDGPAPVPIAQGSGTVMITALPAARKDDKMACGAAISSGSDDVVVGEEAVTYMPVASEVPEWLDNLAIGMVIVGSVVAIGAGALGALAAGGTCGLIGFAGQTIGGFIGGAIGGEVGGAIGEAIGGERGRIIGETLGGFAGGHFGSKAGGRMTAGHPVDVATGELYTKATEFTLGGPIPLVWTRLWMSSSTHEGALGSRWHHPLDWALARTPGGWAARIDEGRLALFLDPLPGRPALNTVEGLMLKTDGNGTYWISDYQGRDHLFGPAGTQAGAPHERPLAEIRDANGNSIRCLRGAAGHLAGIIDSGGRMLPVTCDAAGRILAIDGPHPDRAGGTQRLASYEYDEAGRLVSARDARGSAWRYQYQGHLLTGEQRRGGIVYHFVWDDVLRDRAARCIETWGDAPADGGVAGDLNYARLVYDEGARTTIVTSGLGALTRYGWNARGSVETVVDPLGGLTALIHDEGGREIEVVRPDGAARTADFDAFGRIVRRVNYDGAETAWTYIDDDLDRVGFDNPAVMRIPGGASWKHQYDERGNLVATLDPLGVERRILRNPSGAPLAVLDPLGPVRRFAWSAEGELVSAGMGVNDRVRYGHDALGRIVSIQRGADAPLALTRDANGNLVRILRSDGGTIDIAYDAEDQAIHHRDPLGHETRWDYGGLSQPRLRIAADGTQVRFTYNGEQQLTAIVNETGDLYRLAYDVAGRMESETGYDGRHRAFTYDAAGLLLAVVDQGRETRHRRDAAGRLLETQHADGQVDRFEWDAAGRLTAAHNAARAVEFTYDRVGQMASEIQDGLAILHEHDPRGRRVASVLPDGRRIETLFDADDDVASMRFDGRELARFAYDAAGREIERRAGAVLQRQSYDPHGRLMRQEGSASFTGHEAQSVFAREYGYDVADRVVAMNDARFGAKRYGYDACDRLLEAGGLDPERFVVDPAGDLLAMAGSDTAAADQETLRFGGDAQGGRLVRSGRDMQFAYDAWGNLASERRAAGEEVHYEHDANDQLVAVRRKAAGVIGEAGTTRFGYDALGRRAWKQTALGRVNFLWNGDVLLGESAPVPVTFANDEPAAVQPEDASAADPLARVYLFEPDSFRPLAQIRRAQGGGSHVYNYHLDRLGTPREITNDNGELVWSAQLKAWGGLSRVAVAEIDNPLRFQGQYHDAETGLHYNRYRYYAPEQGRYIEQDPIRLAGGLNLYQYGPDPVSWYDPLGLVGENTPGYNVYGLYEQGANKPYYVGITDNLDRRAGEHAASGRITDGTNGTKVTEMRPLDKNVTYGQARGYEQAYIDEYGTKTGTIGEKITPENRGNKVNGFDVNSKTRDPARQKAFNDARESKMAEFNGSCK